MRVLSIVAYLLACTSILAAQAPRVIPRPPAQVPNAPPDGVGIDSVDWPQPQQLDSLMGKILRIAFYSGRLIPGWRDNLFVCALAGKHLARLVLERNRVVAEERLLSGLDTRLRDVHEGPDGALYVLTDGNDGKILRLAPKR